jgi:ankyrin repeat protein
VVQILLLAGADAYVKDREGDNALDNALAGGHQDVAEVIKTFAGGK